MLEVCPRTVFRMSERRELPPPIKFSRLVARWRLRELVHWIDATFATAGLAQRDVPDLSASGGRCG
jgi:hypothetical protein